MRVSNRRVLAAVTQLSIDQGGRPARAGRSHPRRDPEGHPAGGGDNGGGQGGGQGAGAGGQNPPAGNPNGDNDGQSQSKLDGSGDEFKSEYSRNSVLADLAAERELNRQLKQQIEDANKPEDQKAREAREKQETQARNDARFRQQAVAAKAAGLSLEWVERIAGSTPEEMLTDAKALKKDLDERSSSGQSTDGAGAAGDGDPASNASPGVGRANAYYATQKK